MNSLRIARTALRVRPTAVRAPLQRRGYAEAVSDKVGILGQILRATANILQIKLSLALPHQVCRNWSGTACEYTV
jgi:F-type H+-transporting ATPase subunit delta